MKKVIIDVNILKREKIDKIKKSNIKQKLGKSLKLYISEVCLKQRFPFLYEKQLREDYNYYIDFIKEYCENEIIDAASEVIGKEIYSNFKFTQIYSAATVKGLYYYEDNNNKIQDYDIKNSHQHKISTTLNLQSFVNELKADISDAYNVIMWKQYCYNFIYKYDFAIKEMNNFLSFQSIYDKNTFINLLKLWWRYSIVASTLRHFQKTNIPIEKFYTMVSYNIPRNSFAYRKFKADDYIIEYSLVNGRKIDKDTPNDTTYIAHMNNFDILLTDDGMSHEKFMKSCFKHVYSDKEAKEILNLDEFLTKFG